VISHPDVPGSLLHFTGRTRSPTDVLPLLAAGDPQMRLANILRTAGLMANPTFRSRGPVLCMSELSTAALHVLLTSGLNERGPYQPWGVVLDRRALCAVGAGPVWYMRDAEYDATNDLPAYLADRRVRSNPYGVPDWDGEREWRLCWGDQPAASPGLALDRGNTLAVIVGTSGWGPSAPYSGWPTWYGGLPRWVWTGAALLADGFL
jgi:hypothetical protein